jgi:hypothetical protein
MAASPPTSTVPTSATPLSIQQDNDKKGVSGGLHKCSSTGSMFVTSTINEPQMDEVVCWVSTMLHSQMKFDASADAKRAVVLAPFEEPRYTGKPLGDKPPVPALSTVYQFLKNLFDVGQFSPECCVVLLIYVNRLIGLTSVAITPSNWRPISVIALVLAQKVWDDDCIGNDEFPILYPILTNADVNVLEKEFMRTLDFKLGVSPQLYAQYYFELRTIVNHLQKQPDLSLRMFDHLHPLDRLQCASKLSHTETLTYQYYRNRKHPTQRSQTLEDIIPKLPSSIVT